MQALKDSHDVGPQAGGPLPLGECDPPTLERTNDCEMCREREGAKPVKPHNRQASGACMRQNRRNAIGAVVGAEYMGQGTPVDQRGQLPALRRAEYHPSDCHRRVTPVRRNEHKPATRSQHPSDLPEHSDRIGQVLQNHVGRDKVEAAVSKG